MVQWLQQQIGQMSCDQRFAQKYLISRLSAYRKGGLPNLWYLSDIVAEANMIQAVHEEETIKELGKKIRETQKQLIMLTGGYESEANSLLEDFLNLYNQRESKLFEAIYILGACDAETYL